MEEKILSTRKNGLAVLIGCLLLELLSVVIFVYGINKNFVVMGVGIAVMAVSWFPLIGLRVLKPEEALVVTLFGNGIRNAEGTLDSTRSTPFCQRKPHEENTSRTER